MIDFFEFSNEMLCLANEQGYFTRVNPAWTKTLGWSADELTSRPFVDFVHPDDLAATIQEAELLRGGRHETIFFENRYRCRDGSYRWMAWQAVLEPDTRQLVASARDITDQKLQTVALREQEAELRASREKLLLALEASRMCTWELDLGTRVIAWSKTVAALLGNDMEEMHTRFEDFLEKIYPEDRVGKLNSIAARIEKRGGEQHLHQFRYVRSDGSVRWIESSGRPHFDSAGRPIRIVGVMMDITERKEAEEALRESEGRFHAFMSHSPALAWVKDEQGRYVYMNKVFEEFIGIRPREWLGKTDFDFWSAEEAGHLRSVDRQVLNTGQPVQTTERSSFSGHRDDYFLKTKFFFQDNRGGRFVGGVGFNVTEQRRAEQALRTEQELLRNLIEVQEQEKQFLCHEFHDGLIQYAFGSAMLLESCRCNPQAADNAAKIDAAIANLRRGIDDGRRVIRGIRPAVLDDSGLEAAIEDLVGQFATSGIHVTGKCDPDIGRLPESIQTTVYRVVQEALNNAKKYSGTDVVRIELKKVAGDLHLEVRDFGCGFDVESARKKGFGLLGMAERVRLLGGECRIQSALDAGTCIFVRLPIPATNGET